jgi:hypothetical protein
VTSPWVCGQLAANDVSMEKFARVGLGGTFLSRLLQTSDGQRTEGVDRAQVGR